jgi:hypothetical protein
MKFSQGLTPRILSQGLTPRILANRAAPPRKSPRRTRPFARAAQLPPSPTKAPKSQNPMVFVVLPKIYQHGGGIVGGEKANAQMELDEAVANLARICAKIGERFNSKHRTNEE